MIVVTCIPVACAKMKTWFLGLFCLLECTLAQEWRPTTTCASPSPVLRLNYPTSPIEAAPIAAKPSLSKPVPVETPSPEVLPTTIATPTSSPTISMEDITSTTSVETSSSHNEPVTSTIQPVTSSTSLVILPSPTVRPEEMPFLSFSAWKERQEQLWESNLPSLGHKLPMNKTYRNTTKHIDPVTSSRSNTEAQALPDPTYEVEQEESALAEPIKFIHPLPFSGTNLPDDPLLRLSSRTNYAGVDCSASVLKSSRYSKGASSILHSAKDRYMLHPCSAKEKWVIMELCEEIDVDAIVLANWEFFSSMFKVFTLHGSGSYPGTKDDWVDLGAFRAGNVRAPQVSILIPLARCLQCLM